MEQSADTGDETKPSESSHIKIIYNILCHFNDTNADSLQNNCVLTDSSKTHFYQGKSVIDSKREPNEIGIRSPDNQLDYPNNNITYEGLPAISHDKSTVEISWLTSVYSTSSMELYQSLSVMSLSHLNSLPLSSYNPRPVPRKKSKLRQSRSSPTKRNTLSSNLKTWRPKYALTFL